MAEVYETEESDGLDIQRYIDVVRRRHLYFLIPLLLGWLVVWGASFALQTRYKSSTLILVEGSTMPRNYVVPNVSDDLQDRLQSIMQQILSRTRLLFIINKLNLYRGKNDHKTPDDMVNQMRKDIGVELIRDSQGSGITAFRISYSAHDPHVAQKVTRELTNLFITANLKVRQQESEDTTDFLEGQLESARSALAGQEEKVRQFEAAHEGELPTQQESNLQILAGLQAQLQNEQDSLNNANQQRALNEALLGQYRAARGPARTENGVPIDIAAVDQQLEKLRAKLADLRSRYTDSYPDVQTVKNQIARTEVQREQVVAADKAKAKAAKPGDEGAGSHDATGVPSPEMAQLQGQLQANHLEINSREQAITALKDRINSYQARLDATPASEQQLADLTRGYDQSKANYDDLLKKKEESQMATSMEEMQQGERFTILDPPSFPMKPDFPNRLKFCAMGLGFGFALGLITVVGFEFLDGRLHTDKQIRELLPVPVISEIPVIASAEDERSNKRRVFLGWATTAVVVVTILAGAAVSYLHD
jgi:polysaccharide chain length determinant protein (PEP-CTERM system associated)